MKGVVVLLRCWLLSLDNWVDNSDNYILKNAFYQGVSTSLITYLINLWVNAYCLLYSQLNVQEILSTTVSPLSGGSWYLNYRMRIQFSPVAKVRQYLSALEYIKFFDTFLSGKINNLRTSQRQFLHSPIFERCFVVLQLGVSLLPHISHTALFFVWSRHSLV
mgnify:CR=1 FL=1